MASDEQELKSRIKLILDNMDEVTAELKEDMVNEFNAFIKKVSISNSRVIPAAYIKLCEYVMSDSYFSSLAVFRASLIDLIDSISSEFTTTDYMFESLVDDFSDTSKYYDNKISNINRKINTIHRKLHIRHYRKPNPFVPYK